MNKTPHIAVVERAASDNREHARPTPATMTILAVDDDPLVLALIPRIATLFGYAQVTTASSGEEALAVIARDETAFDCFLLDIRMPGMNGIELCTRIRSLPNCRFAPIIMMTSLSDLGYLKEAFEAGATDFVRKPLEVTDFNLRLGAAEVQFRGGKSHQAQRSDEKSLDHSNAVHAQSLTFDPRRREMIPGANSLIHYATLATYLDYLLRSRQASPVVLAVTVAKMDTICKNHEPAEVAQLLQQVAAAISDVFGADKYMGAYAGDGSFLIVHAAPLSLGHKAIEALLAWHLSNLGPPRSDGRAHKLEVFVGRPVLAKANRTEEDFGSALRRGKRRVAEELRMPLRRIL